MIETKINGPMNDSYVRVTDEKVDANGFSYAFQTVKGHVEAGKITFSATQDKDGNVTSINSTSKVDYGMVPNNYARDQQRKSWQEILTNAVNYLGGTGVSRSTTIKDQQVKNKK